MAMQNVGERDAVLEDARQDVSRIGAADVVVGIPTYNNRKTIERTAEAALAAIGNGFSGQKVALINADGSSRDGTTEHLREVVGDRVAMLQVRYPVYPVDKFSAPLAGVPGRKEAAVTVFRLARQLGARVCALLDAEVESITGDWIDRLTRPVLSGEADLVVPVYLRRKFDGLINSGILSPFARALSGKRLRQPSGADLGFSAELMDFFVERAGSTAQTPSVVDPWSTMPPITHGFGVGQAFLGARVVRTHEVPPDLSSTLRLVLTNLFEQMEHTASFWQKVRGSETVPWFGSPHAVDAEPVEINRKPMIESFRQGCQDLIEIWRLIMSPATLLELRRLERQPESGFRFRDDTWARVVYDFALAFHLRVIRRDHLLQAITPLYLGWAASFTIEAESASGAEVEERLERLAMEFETQKRYLISRWRWPDKFNP